ncbi:hypothetical protein SAMN04489712_13434 [Thermomonospora echinospora]|uniref:Uncharacterized protein n=1 Tax=Thermomonospora echinospora TaxID=1992 RepID=A0A1H6E5T1_9ACTN|nr:hypothetical protein [Thermomonospora echinospora]SEG92559.1 hypothetical protein SAMN04489712_13434 [Thermomonospora echinospora]
MRKPAKPAKPAKHAKPAKRVELKPTGRVALTGLAGAVLVTGITVGTITKLTAEPAAAEQIPAAAARQEAGAPTTVESKAAAPRALLTGYTTASYFWDDGSGIRGDTGAPASGKPMQKGMFASPSWPLLTKVKVTYNGRSVVGFVGDRGPGEPSHRGIMLDLDTYSFRYLHDGGRPASKYHAGTDVGHLKGVKYEVLEWGSGRGEKGAPKPFGT